MERYLGALLIVIILFLTKDFRPTPSVLAEHTKEPASEQADQVLPVSQPIKTDSRFTQKLEEQTESIPKKIIFQDDPETEAGEEKVLDEGEDGKQTKIIKITYADGEEYEKETVSTEKTEPKDKKILRGTKIVWKTLDSPDGEIKYWKKMRVYATHYDSHCPGCDATTAIGLRAGKGVIAVDPSVIPLRTKVYIPGYGPAIAGDTGGAIKGNIIDLGFDDARTSGWSAKFVDIYML